MSRILILKEAPYGSREESPQMTELMNGNYAGKPEACTICGGSPVVAGARYRNPLGNVDFTHHVCEPCADQYDIMHSSDKYKGEPMDIAMRLLKKLPPHWNRDFDSIEDLHDPTNGIQSMRAMSLQDAQDVEDMKLRPKNVEFEQDLTTPGHRGAESIVPGIHAGKIFDEDLISDGGGFVYRPHLNALAPNGQYTDMPSSPRPNVLVATTEKPEFRASKNEGRIQTEGFMPGGMDPDQAYLLSDPTKPFTREDILQQARVKQAGETPHHERTDIEIEPSDGYATASQALETLPNHKKENPFTEMGTWGNPRTVGGVWFPQQVYTSEPMEIAMRLLKNEPTDYADTYQQVRNNIGADGSHMSDKELESINRRYSQLHDDESHPEEYYNLLEAIELEQMRRQNQSFDAVGLNEETDFTRGEPMEIAMQLLKEEDDVPDMSKFGLPIQRPTSLTYRDGVTEQIPYERRGQKYEFKSPTNEREMRAEAEKQRRAEQGTPIPKVSPTMNEVENQPTWPTNTPYNEETGFTRSEPMEIAMRLLKERVSPEAKRHKLEYDKKYESSPERVKYREELNRERRRRHIMGQGGPDMSHTSQHTIVPEDPHTNRARHFKDKGTLL